jgi:dienelactone hydrolase
MRKILKVILSLFFVYVLASAAGAYWVTSQFKPSLPFNTSALGFAVEDVEVRTTDGLTLRGWYSEGPPGSPVVILLHGHHNTRTDCITLARELTLPGYSLLLLDMRASGKSEGMLHTLGYKERFDVEAAIQYLKNEKRVPPKHIGLVAYGTSAVAAILAYSTVHDLGAAVLVGPYAGLELSINNRIVDGIGARASWLGFLTKEFVGLRVGQRVGMVRPSDDIGKLAPCPVMLVGAGNDAKTPPEEIQQLFDRAENPKALYIAPGVSRERLSDLSGSDLKRRLLEFLDENLR